MFSVTGQVTEVDPSGRCQAVMVSGVWCGALTFLCIRK